MFRRASQTIVLTENNILEILLNNDLTELQKIITSANINNILTKYNKYTALHYAITFKLNNNIIEFLISKGSNLDCLDNLGKDCYDLALENNIKIITDKMKKPRDNEINILKDEINTKKRRINELEYKYNELKQEVSYINDINTELNDKNKRLKSDNEELTRGFEIAMKKHKK